MPTVDFGACLSNYWFVWTINGVGTILALVINMVVSYFFLKFFTIAQKATSAVQNPISDFSNVNSSSLVNDIPAGPWSNDATMGNAFSVSQI